MIPVVINGSNGVGKDTFATMCGQYCLVKNISSIDQLNDFARLIGWNGVKDNSYRLFMSELKQTVTKFNDAPTKYLLEHITLNAPYSGLLFMHIREPLEIGKIQRLSPLPVITLLIRRSLTVAQNIADLGVSNYLYDYTIENSGTMQDLLHKAEQFVNEVLHDRL